MKTIAMACALLAAVCIPAPTPAQTPIRFSAAAALALPAGDLGNAADPGYNLDFRGEGRLGSPAWGLRGDFSLDHFGGKGIVDSYSYLALAGNVLHRSTRSRAYEFGGLGLYTSRTAFRDQFSHDDTNLGLQLGVGLDLGPGPNSTFLEFGLTNVFTPNGGSLWFPVRFGVRF